MSHHPIQRVQPGSRLRMPAAAYNAFADAADYVRARQVSGGAGVGLAAPATNTIVVIKNAGDQAVPRFGVLGIDGVLVEPDVNLDEFQRSCVLTGVTPDPADHRGAFVVALEPIAAGGIGRGGIAGAFVARIGVTSADHQFADISDSVTELQSQPLGSARILWKESGTGSKWAVVLLGGGGGQHLVPLRITGIRNRPGVYAAKVFTITAATFDTAGSSAVTASEFGEDDGDTVTAFNLFELEATGHALIGGGNPTHRLIFGRPSGFTDDQGRDVYFIDTPGICAT